MNINTTFRDGDALKTAVPVEDAMRTKMINAAEEASRRIPPLWPLKNFVAVNPMLGFTNAEFGNAAQSFAAMCGAHLTMPRAYYATALSEGRISDNDIMAALDELGLADNYDPLSVKQNAKVEPETSIDKAQTIADVASEIIGADLAGFVVDNFSFWAAAYYDEGQAY
ncbi:MAG: putative inorganic carbon transporter subunit DabA, partial [Hyphococcus sp.]